MTMMKEKAVKDLAQYNAEMKELERLIAHEQNLKDFMATKCNKRTGLEDALSHRHGESSRNIGTRDKRVSYGSSLNLTKHMREIEGLSYSEANINPLLYHNYWHPSV